MDLGIFFMPHAAPERSVQQTAGFVLDVVREADALGYREAWIGEHFACGWEPVPAPDLLIAQALLQTEQIVLAPGAHVLPYHHPVELAHRVAYLDHLAEGRYMLGVATGSVMMDADLFGCIVRGADGSTRLRNIDMTQEALDIMLKIWTSEEGFNYEGEFWSFRRQDYDDFEKGPFLKPYQKPHPPIGMAGLSVGSATLAAAGRYGFLPMSFNFGGGYLAGHWDTYLEAATKAGHDASRDDWRVSPPFFVADTDAEAARLASTGENGRFWREYMIPGMVRRGITRFVKDDPADSDDVVTPEFLARKHWLVGSPATVAERLVDQYRSCGGFGTLLGMVFDYMDDVDSWMNSLELLKQKVMPLVEQALAGDRAT